MLHRLQGDQALELDAGGHRRRCRCGGRLRAPALAFASADATAAGSAWRLRSGRRRRRQRRRTASCPPAEPRQARESVRPWLARVRFRSSRLDLGFRRGQIRSFRRVARNLQPPRRWPSDANATVTVLSAALMLYARRLPQIDHHPRDFRSELRQPDFAHRIEIAGDVPYRRLQVRTRKIEHDPIGILKMNRVIVERPGAENIDVGLVAILRKIDLLNRRESSIPGSCSPRSWRPPEPRPVSPTWSQRWLELPPGVRQVPRNQNASNLAHPSRSIFGCTPGLSNTSRRTTRFAARSVGRQPVALDQVRWNHANARRVAAETRRSGRSHRGSRWDGNVVYSNGASALHFQAHRAIAHLGLHMHRRAVVCRQRPARQHQAEHDQRSQPPCSPHHPHCCSPALA